jgi:exopolysaccharide production protein ExoQ
MPPILALGLTCVFVLWLFVRDEGSHDGGSPALWLPLAWLWFTGTRFLTQWLSLGSWSGPTTSEDGSLLDALVFGGLTLAGLIVLAKRHSRLDGLARRNRWIIALLIYGLISVGWSDFPFVSFKRWVKSLGNPVMALVVLTDANPMWAFRLLFRRLAYLVLPLSVMMIKYFPEYARSFDLWSGQPLNSGVAISKNELGQLCLILGISVTWDLLLVREEKKSQGRKSTLIVLGGLAAMLGWLMFMANSKTSLVTLIIGVSMCVGLRTAPAIRRHFGLWVGLLVVAYLVLNNALDVYDSTISALGRDPTLTDRTNLWRDVLSLQPNVLVGAGYEAFWLGDRLNVMWQKWWWQPNQSHNGYIETYANGGLLGLGLLCAMLVSAFISINRNLKSEVASQVNWAQMQITMLVVIAIYNYTEATFKGVNALWTLWYLIGWQMTSARRGVGATNRGAVGRGVGRLRKGSTGIKAKSGHRT